MKQIILIAFIMNYIIIVLITTHRKADDLFYSHVLNEKCICVKILVIEYKQNKQSKIS